jgi:putative peptide maturation system protein
MATNVNEIVIDVFDYVAALVRDGVRPEDAQSRLHLIRARHPAAELDLVWQEEAYDQSVHYDALVSLPPHGTVSISVCPDDALPWPLRGLHRWNDQDLVRVNDTTLKVQQAIACLDFIWSEAPIAQRLINACLVQEELQKNPVNLTDAELQEAMDGFRKAHRLYTAETTHQWMARRGLTHEKLEEYVGDEAIVANLRGRVADGCIDAYFAAHRSSFDRVHFAQVGFPDAADAQRAFEQIRSGDISLYDVARQRALDMPAGSHQQRLDMFAVLHRGEAPDRWSDLFDAAPGDLLPPIHTEDGYVLAQVIAVVPACLDEATRDQVTRVLFDAWLEERRRKASIEWNWGNAQRTAVAGGLHPPLQSVTDGER